MTTSDNRRRGWEKRRAALDAAFWSRADQSAGPDGCWPWTGSRNRLGYGTLIRHRRLLRAPRVALSLSLGRELEPGEHALHSCDNPPCINPRHLHPGTHAENMAEAVERGMFASGERHGSRTKPWAFTGTSLPGERHPMARLRDEHVLAIRARLRDGARRKDLAVEYGVSLAAIHDIAGGRSWRHLLEAA